MKFLAHLIIGTLAAAAAAAQPVTLRLVNWATPEEMDLDRKAIVLFEERHSGIRVLYEPNPGRQYEEKILTALAAGAPPDVFLLDSKLIPTFTNKRVLLDLTPYIGPLGIDTTQWFPNVLAIGRRNGGLYAFPKGFTPLMMFYNRALFREAGIAEPTPSWTWGDHRRIAASLTRDRDGDGTPDQYGTSFTNYYYFWIVWVWSAGGDVVTEDGLRATGALTSAATEEAITFLTDQRTRDRVAPDVGSWVQSERTGTNAQLFANGRVAMSLDGHWRLPTYARYVREGKLDLGVAPLPLHPSGRKVNVMYQSGWCVPVGASHPREAAMLAAFMAGPEAARIRSSQHLEIPAVRSVAEEIVAIDPYGWERPFVEEVPFCRQPWGSVIERFSEIEWTLQDAVDDVVLNGVPVNQALAKAALKVDRQLEEIRSHAAFTFAPIEEHSEILQTLAAVAAAVAGAMFLLYRRARRRDRPAALRSIGFLAPSLIHLTVFLATPMVFSAYLSLHRWDLVVPDTPFVGLENFVVMFGDESFWNALRNTLLFSLNVPFGLALALGVALLLHRRFTGVAVLRTIYFLPSVTSFVAIALVWMWIYHPTFGAANYLLSLLGLPPIPWLNSTQTAMLSVVIFTIWLGMGYQMVVFLAGLQGIPEEYYEAARMDGATAWQRFRRVTFPLLMPTTFFLLITSLISSFQAFTSIYVMTAGGPVGSTDVIVYHIYQAAWEQLRMGYASAMAWVLFVLILAATWVQFRLVGRGVEYS
ncbi:MAG: extracellular solute-binding protein [Bacteroidetes bacterium]|jgi:multiple sugar transport system permease protein|nr:extracellular solute-binding protein [Bacteroidota bacterium]